MTSRFPPLLVAALVAVLTACGSDEAPADGENTSGTARGLLSSVQEGEAGGSSEVPEQPGVLAPPAQEVSVDTLGFDYGDADAPIRIVEFSDYGCGYCRRFHEDTWPVLLEQYIETGKVHWKFLPFVSGMFANSLPASRAAECTLAQGGDRFRTFNGRLWDNQAEWKGSNDAESTLRAMAEDAGTSMDEWDECMDSNRRIDRVRAATGIAQDLGVRGTPTFFVMGYPPLQGALPTETFTQLLDMIYAQEVAAGNAGGA